MSKIIIGIIVVLTILPFVTFLAWEHFQENDATSTEVEELIMPKDVSTEPRPGDSPSCALCRQIPSGESQAQCLKDFACTN
jgi:hypothetical protein